MLVFKGGIIKSNKNRIVLPINILETTNLHKEKDSFVCDFLNFSQYKGIARKVRNNYILAIIYPKFLKRLFN